MELECRVTPDSVTLLADDQSVLEWSGDPARLSVDPAWTVPRRDWLFLASHESIFAISHLTLSTPQP